MNQPLVTIIVVSHNQAAYIQEAVASAFDQDYDNLEVILVDDGSTDATDQIISTLSQIYRFEKIINPSALGYCRAFNLALARASGSYIIDLAADDILLPERVSEGVANLLTTGAGVDFCDAYFIDHSSAIVGAHYPRDKAGAILEPVPDGDIFEHLLKRYFICAPTMFIDRKVLDKLQGYDESLYYEDFDFWVRSSRWFNYHFTNKVLVKKRVHANSMSKSQYQPHSKMLPTTLRVCQKAYHLCQKAEEFQALRFRINYELRQSIVSNNYAVAKQFLQLLGLIEKQSLEYKFWGWLVARGWDISFLTRFISKAR